MIHFQDLGESQTNDTQQETAMDTTEPPGTEKESNSQDDGNPKESGAVEPMELAPVLSGTETPAQETMAPEGEQSDAPGLYSYGP